MKIPYYALAILIGSLLSLQANSVTVYECVDEEGNVTLQDHCPAGTSPAGEKKVRTGASSTAAPERTVPGLQPDVDITLYTAKGCDACIIMQSVLNEYSAPFTTKDIGQDEAKKELNEKTGGSNTITVPTVVVGEDVIAGFNKDGLAQKLESVGFKKPEPEEAEEPEAAAVEPESAPAGEESPGGETAAAE